MLNNKNKRKCDMCQTCGCEPCEMCGAAIEDGVCSGCGEPAENCVCIPQKE